MNSLNPYPPGPKAEFFGIPLVNKMQKDPLSVGGELREYDPKLVHYQLGPIHAYMLNHPEMIHEVLVKQAKKFYKWQRQKEVFGKFNGNGLVNSDGDFWKRQRKLVQPAFHSQRIARYADLMTEYTLRHIQQWQAGQTLEIGQQMSFITRDIVTKALFDADVSAESRRIGEIIGIIQELGFRELGQFFSLPDWLPHKRHERQALQEIDTIIQRFIADRRKSRVDHGDLLSMLLLAKDENGETMTDQQARDEAMTLFIAGHETTATALSWLWYLIAAHPEVEAKLLAEIGALGGKTPTFEDVPRLKYTLMVIKETMRLYPPTWFYPREVAEPVELNGYTLKPKSLVHLFVYWIHHDERFWQHPEQFDPERFSPEREHQIVPYSYFPFGGGPRVCIGNSFALMEMQLIVATILQHWRLPLATGQSKPELLPLITLLPKGGIRVQVRSGTMRATNNQHEAVIGV